MKVVSNTSPIIFLTKINRLELVNKLYGPTIILPQSVYNELLFRDLPGTPFIKNNPPYFSIMPSKKTFPGLDFLGKGERECIEIGKTQAADLILMDDKMGRGMAQALNLRVKGTAGILLEAQHKGLISHSQFQSDLVNLMKNHYFRISADLFSAILQTAKTISKIKKNIP